MKYYIDSMMFLKTCLTFINTPFLVSNISALATYTETMCTYISKYYFVAIIEKQDLTTR